MVGADDELVIARLGRDHRPFPADRELVRIELLGFGTVRSEIEIDLRVDPIKDAAGFPGNPAN